jgi:hypothetical protein
MSVAEKLPKPEAIFHLSVKTLRRCTKPSLLNGTATVSYAGGEEDFPWE